VLKSKGGKIVGSGMPRKVIQIAFHTNNGMIIVG
jgi:hypothetical protein